MLVVFSPFFVADTKITFVYNFVAPLSKKTFYEFQMFFEDTSRTVTCSNNF